MLKGEDWKCEAEGQGQNGLSSCKKREVMKGGVREGSVGHSQRARGT